jgi:histidinol-phosphate aminotransferase
LVGRLGETIGLEILSRPDLVADRVAELKAERESLESWLSALEGVEVLPGAANFFLVRTPLEHTALHRAMAERGVLIRDVTGYPALAPTDDRPGWLRVSVGSPDENKVTRDAFAAVLGLEVAA